MAAQATAVRPPTVVALPPLQAVGVAEKGKHTNPLLFIVIVMVCDVDDRC
jgi:hypothetical protein